MWFTPFEFFFELEVDGVAFLSACFARPSGYQAFVDIDYSFELLLDLDLGQAGILIWLLVAGIGSVVISVLPVKCLIKMSVKSLGAL